MARNICSQCHRVLCSSGVRQPASPPATQIILSWSGQRNLYTFQECQQRATGTCIHLGNCAGKDLQHTAGGALEICIHFRGGPETCIHLRSATPGLSKPNTMGPNQTLPTQTQHQPNQILSSKAKEKREKTSQTETAWSSTETKQVMDDLNLREELAKIIRTHIAKTEDIKMHQVSVLQKDTGNQTQT